MADIAGLAKSSCSHYVPVPMNDLFDKHRPPRNLDGGRADFDPRYATASPKRLRP
jgi:hypothetical protein